eukprot:357485-Chlamydomonas_euryale.AAC.1
MRQSLPEPATLVCMQGSALCSCIRRHPHLCGTNVARAGTQPQPPSAVARALDIRAGWQEECGRAVCHPHHEVLNHGLHACRLLLRGNSDRQQLGQLDEEADEVLRAVHAARDAAVAQRLVRLRTLTAVEQHDLRCVAWRKSRVRGQ